MNFYELCEKIHNYVIQHFNENNQNMLNHFSERNIQHMIRQKDVSEIEFVLNARKNMDSIKLLDSLHFYTKLNLSF